MKIGILGSGRVGQAIAGKLVSLGHEVKVGSRDPGKLADWVRQAGAKSSAGTFAETAAFGEIVFNCTAGSGTLAALNAAGADNLRGKILVDIANPLDFSHGMPPSLTVCNTDSLGEQIQRAFPDAKVVKTLNTITAPLQVNPRQLPEDTAVFVSGNDDDAKTEVARILRDWFGWRQIVDLGDIKTARGAEMFLPLWLHLMGTLGTPLFNIKIVQ